MIKKHVKLLGFRASDKVTGMRGVITTVSFDLFGCVQVVVTPPVDDKGASVEGCWFDISRLTIESAEPVMAVPNFETGPVAEGLQGAAPKPAGRHT